MRFEPINWYVGLVSLLAVFCLAMVPWQGLAMLPAEHVFGLSLLMALSLLSEKLAVGFSFNPRGGSHTITFIPLLAAVLLFGPAAPVLLMTVTGAAAEILIRRKEPIRAAFNVAQYALATCLAGWAFTAAGGMAGADLEKFAFQIVPLTVFLIVFMGINHSSVSFAISLSQRLTFREVWSRLVGPTGLNLLYDLLVSPLAIVVGFFYWEASWLGLLLSIFPLLFIRHGYLNN